MGMSSIPQSGLDSTKKKQAAPAARRALSRNNARNQEGWSAE